MTQAGTISNYFKEAKEDIWFRKAAFAYIFSLYVMPQYFGIPNPIFDITIVRMAIIILAFFIMISYERYMEFKDVLVKEKMGLVLIPYIIVLIYTMILRTDANAFLNPFIEILELYLLIYVIRSTFGAEKTTKIIISFIYLLTILGVVEAVIKVSPFSYLETIPGIYTGRFVRGGHYRIMSSCGHSLGYGLLLVTAMPFAAYDYDKKELNVFRRPVLMALVIANIFMTGSRSSLGVGLAEFAALLIFSDIKFLKRNLFVFLSFIVAFFFVTFTFQNTGLGQYILLQLTSLVDAFFGTTFSIAYGANYLQMQQSAAYRDLLHKVFTVEWLNPFLGIGRQRYFRGIVDGRKVESIDNFYIAEFVRYAYPGMFAYIFFLGVTMLRMLIDEFKTRSALIRMVLISTVFYCLHLYIADTLQTLKYLYVGFAIYACADKTEYVPPKDPCKYIKKESRIHYV